MFPSAERKQFTRFSAISEIVLFIARAYRKAVDKTSCDIAVSNMYVGSWSMAPPILFATELFCEVDSCKQGAGM